MRYGPDEEAEYFAARDQLVADFRAWKPDAPERGYGAETLLDFKWGYDDGDLLTWRIEHVDEVLIDWMPRKVLVDDDEAIAMAMDIAELGTWSIFPAAIRARVTRESSSADCSCIRTVA